MEGSLRVSTRRREGEIGRLELMEVTFRQAYALAQEDDWTQEGRVPGG